MATTLTSKLKLILTHTFQNSLDLSAPIDDLRLDLSDELAQGTATDQADQVWHDRRTLVGVTENLDLAGALTNAFGSTITFVTLKALVLHNRTLTTAATLTVGGAAANAFATPFGAATDKIIVQPDGLLLLWAPRTGYAVTAATGDILKLDPGSATVEYDIYLLGTTA